jgi:hypothetical protein
MIDFSLRRTTHWGLALIGVALVAGNATKARAVVIAYDGFAYTAGTKIVDQNGDEVYDDGLGAAGGGWAGPWDNLQGAVPDASVIQAGSLGYTDGLGNVLTTTGGKLYNTGSAGNSQPGRTLAVRRDGVALGATATTPVSTWMSFLAIRTGTKTAPTFATPIRANTFARGANLSLFDNDANIALVNEEKINVGESSTVEYPFTTGNDLLRLQQAAAVDPAQFDIFKQRFGTSSTLAAEGYDTWMLRAPRVQASVTAIAAPAYVDPIDGTITNARDWHVNPNNNATFRDAYTTTPFGDEVSLMLMRIDHYGGAAPRDALRIWMNPNLNTAPSDASASAVMDLGAINARAIEIGQADGAAFNTPTGNTFSFDRIRLFAGLLQNAGAANETPFAEWQFDELRLGTTFGDVTPHGGGVTAVPEPGTLALVAAALAAVRGLRRRK